MYNDFRDVIIGNKTKFKDYLTVGLLPRMTPGNNPETFMYNNNHGESLQTHRVKV